MGGSRGEDFTNGHDTRHESEISAVLGGGLTTMLHAMEVPSHARHLLLQLNTQRTKGFLCDVIIVVQNALFRAHKNILAASSLYLKSLVVHDNLINLDHEMVSPGVFRVILDYIYTGRLTEGDPSSPTEPNLGAVLAAASYLQLLDLVALCKKKMRRNGKYPLRPTPAFLPYGKMGPNSLGLGGGGRYRVSTPVIQSCYPGGVVNTHTPRAPPVEELPPHPHATHAGELYAPTSSQGPQVFPSTPSALPAQPSLRPAHSDRNCSPIYGLDLSKKSPNSQSQNTPSHPHLAHALPHHDEEREGGLSGRTSPMLANNGGAYPTEKMETADQAGSLPPHSYPHLNKPLGPHLPHLHRSSSQGPDHYPCPLSPDTPTEAGVPSREMGNIYRWVKHEPLSYTAEDEEDDEDEEEGGGNGDQDHQHHNHHHKAGEESDDRYRRVGCDGEDEKSGSGSEGTGSSEGRPSPTGAMGRFHLPYEPESFGDNLYVCIPCDKGFPSSEQLNAHVETHTEEELYSGGEMGLSNPKNNSSNSNGNGSMNSLEGKASQSLTPGVLGEIIRPYRCNSCEKSYKDPATLRQHEKTHWLTRPYPCSICGKKFTQRGTMTRHMRSHLGLKPFACDHCGMRFTRQYRLTEHMRIHSGEKPYECQVCGGKFAQQRNLISHMKMHSSGGGGGALTADGKLKLDFAEGIYPLSKYAAEHLGLKQEKASELLAEHAMESLFPLSKLAVEHLRFSHHDKMDVLGVQALPPPPGSLSDSHSHTIERYSPS
ncbi:hypermethylated in cancer 1 protein isoform X1 [Salmo trutta]|uniref:Hypermethylated in cancer 1 protein n=2 Tax=Salmo trutta TaxID=8032 RepID=A0A674D5R9_SALTR|nr:hypermethylated in cancer 1 protein-like isoform X1 [Salmo trutta]